MKIASNQDAEDGRLWEQIDGVGEKCIQIKSGINSDP